MTLQHFTPFLLRENHYLESIIFLHRPPLSLPRIYQLCALLVFYKEASKVTRCAGHVRRTLTLVLFVPEPNLDAWFDAVANVGTSIIYPLTLLTTGTYSISISIMESGPASFRMTLVNVTSMYTDHLDSITCHVNPVCIYTLSPGNFDIFSCTLTWHSQNMIEQTRDASWQINQLLWFYVGPIRKTFH